MAHITHFQRFDHLPPKCSPQSGTAEAFDAERQRFLAAFRVFVDSRALSDIDKDAEFRATITAMSQLMALAGVRVNA